METPFLHDSTFLKAVEESARMGRLHSPRHSDNFAALNELWDEKWHGSDVVEGSVEIMAQSRQSTLSRLGLEGSLSSRSNCQSGKGKPGLGFFRAIPKFLAPIMGKASSKREEFNDAMLKQYPSGPCLAFADLPIPRYPDDYEWDD